MTERRLRNSELKLQKLEEEEREACEAPEERGILEIFDAADEPLHRDPDRQPDR